MQAPSAEWLPGVAEADQRFGGAPRKLAADRAAQEDKHLALGHRSRTA